MGDPEANEQLDRAWAALKAGNTAELDHLARQVDGFPDGVDGALGRRWIIHAIDSGSVASVGWMLDRRVNLDFRDDEGYTPLLAAIERGGPHRVEILTLLLRAGAPVNTRGREGWTPAHMAACFNKVEALRVLVQFGADLTIRTDIDLYETPLEGARSSGSLDAVRFLEDVLRARGGV